MQYFARQILSRSFIINILQMRRGGLSTYLLFLLCLLNLMYLLYKHVLSSIRHEGGKVGLFRYGIAVKKASELSLSPRPFRCPCSRSGHTLEPRSCVPLHSARRFFRSRFLASQHALRCC